MKILTFALSTFLLHSFLSAQETKFKTESTPKSGQREKLTQHQIDFLNLPEATRIHFAKSFQDALRLFQDKRIFECLQALDELDRIFANGSYTFNLRGSCYVEIRAFDKAIMNYQKAAEISPKDSSIRFNIAEMYFVMEQYKKSREIFEQLLADSKQVRGTLSRLIEFKILLCLISEDKVDEATILANKYDYLDDTPFYYYAKAALAFHDDDSEEANNQLSSASRVFSQPGVLAPWLDTLIEFDYIKSFYGEDEPQIQE